ncbi:hypothetical protein BT63DRAFT_420622 [Microthyrium microscopicum]|uniref:Uncharacterized protein n=1 Tax=Microthyrium microscopicum TaxID=703497 RepID=A0A6A6UVG7_9PEZI|nr:hypothetical protein BT63DRAFT_420622 [Microthyrium microscopicum]
MPWPIRPAVLLEYTTELLYFMEDFRCIQAHLVDTLPQRLYSVILSCFLCIFEADAFDLDQYSWRAMTLDLALRLGLHHNT